MEYSVTTPSHGHISNGLRIRIMEHHDIENARTLHNEDGVLSQLTDPQVVTKLEQEIWLKQCLIPRYHSDL